MSDMHTGTITLIHRWWWS